MSRKKLVLLASGISTKLGTTVLWAEAKHPGVGLKYARTYRRHPQRGCRLRRRGPAWAMDRRYRRGESTRPGTLQTTGLPSHHASENRRGRSPPEKREDQPADASQGRQQLSLLSVKGRLKLRRARWHLFQEGSEAPIDDHLDRACKSPT